MRVGIIGTGEMGSGVGGWLVAHGADAYTSLNGRSVASAERVRRAGIAAVEDMTALARTCTIVLSIVPPDQAFGVAENFAEACDDEIVTSVFVDCNAIAPETSRAIGNAIESVPLGYVDAGIIGGPPADGYGGPRIYACEPHAATFAELNAHGLHVVTVEGEIGTASALKMCYGGITKGVIGIGAAMFACAERAGVADMLAQEFASSQKALDTYLTARIPKCARSRRSAAASRASPTCTKALPSAMRRSLKRAPQKIRAERKSRATARRPLNRVAADRLRRIANEYPA
ncbi:MAG: NAD(P)-dependent oxidoreductase [Candidatus Eremiobacteraeota bacterium]|nr:NAD(P)-dependent oxidoreductase [Candidatus Eremiobacteraeota bacterium]